MRVRRRHRLGGREDRGQVLAPLCIDGRSQLRKFVAFLAIGVSEYVVAEGGELRLE
jgi:hypothetical protein